MGKDWFLCLSLYSNTIRVLWCVMAISLKDTCSCIGLSGNISIIRDFYGYSSVPNAFPGGPNNPAAPGIERLSLLQQVTLIKNGFHVRLHIKILVAPTNAT